MQPLPHEPCDPGRTPLRAGRSVVKPTSLLLGIGLCPYPLFPRASTGSRIRALLRLRLRRAVSPPLVVRGGGMCVCPALFPEWQVRLDIVLEPSVSVAGGGEKAGCPRNVADCTGSTTRPSSPSCPRPCRRPSSPAGRRRWTWGSRPRRAGWYLVDAGVLVVVPQVVADNDELVLDGGVVTAGTLVGDVIGVPRVAVDVVRGVMSSDSLDCSLTYRGLQRLERTVDIVWPVIPCADPSW